MVRSEVLAAAFFVLWVRPGRGQQQRGTDAALLTRARGTTRDRQEQFHQMLFCSWPGPGTKGREPAGRGLACVGPGANESERDQACTDMWIWSGPEETQSLPRRCPSLLCPSSPFTKANPRLLAMLIALDVSWRRWQAHSKSPARRHHQRSSSAAPGSSTPAFIPSCVIALRSWRSVLRASPTSAATVPLSCSQSS